MSNQIVTDFHWKYDVSLNYFKATISTDRYLVKNLSYFWIIIFREEKRTANIIADDENGVACLVIDRESFNHLIANLEDIKTRYVDLPERKKIIHQEFKALKLSDMRIIATLGVGKSN